MEAKLQLRDHLEIEHIKNGQKCLVHEGDDLIVNAGKTAMAKRIYGTSAAAFTYVAIGEGATGAAAANTTLESEIVSGGGERAAGTNTYVADYIAQLEHTYDFTDSFA